MTDEERFINLAATVFKNRERKISEDAAKIAVDRTIEYLQHIGVLDEMGAPKPGQRLKIRIVDPHCYPPLVLQ